MDINELDKNQIVLLVLLVSFVTSIATGIVTVTLMDQAPPGVTQTINRVVERTVETVEKVVIDDTGKTVIEEVVISEENAIADAVALASPSLARLYVDGGEGVEIFSALAFPVPEYGVLVTDADSVLVDGVYRVRDEAENTFEARVIAEDIISGVAVLEITTEGATLPAIPFGNEANFRLGQRIVALGGSESNEIASSMIVSDPITSPFATDISRGSRFAGGMALTIAGNIAGMIRSQEGSVVVVAPSSILSVVRMALGMETNDTGAEESSTVLPETQTAAVSEAFSEESDN
jgi:S1-C subfamily serine protease